MDGKKIQHAEEVKYLVVTLDRSLTWRPHLKSKIDLCKAMLVNITNKYKHTHTKQNRS